MDSSRGKGESRDIKIGLMCRVHDRPVGISDTNGIGSMARVKDVCSDGAEMCSAAAVGNGNGVGRAYSRGGDLQEPQ